MAIYSNTLKRDVERFLEPFNGALRAECLRNGYEIDYAGRKVPVWDRCRVVVVKTGEVIKCGETWQEVCHSIVRHGIGYRE